MTLEQHEFESVDYNWSLEQYTAKQAIKTYSDSILSGDDKAMSENIWVELYDPKEGRKLREIPLQSKCQECEQFNGHRIDCSNATKENLYRIAKTAQDAEAQARKRADRYWQMLQQYQGKLATLKHENNKLRKENHQLKASISKRPEKTGGTESVPSSPTSLDLSNLRRQFEAWISSPPYEMIVKRLADKSAWPGQYDDVSVQLAFEAWIESEKCNKRTNQERLPQRFRYRKLGCNGWDFGVCIPCGNSWSVRAGAGFGSFEADPSEIVGHIIGNVEAFEWIDNDFGWEG